MERSGEPLPNISDVSETLLLPLYARAIESRSRDPILVDKKALEITKKLDQVFSRSDSRLHQRLRKGRLRRVAGKKLAVALSLRTRRFDRYCKEFLEEHPDGTIVELGCGLSTRFARVDNGRARWFDLDLPEVVAFRERFFQETDRYRFIRSSVLEFTWMDLVTDGGPHLFIAEGLLMYLHEDEVKRLVLALRERFPGSELACEVVNEHLIRTLRRKLWRREFQRDYGLGEEVTFHFGIKDGHELEGWHPGLELLDEWTYFDDGEKRMGWMRLLGRSKKLRKTQWVVHYRLR